MFRKILSWTVINCFFLTTLCPLPQAHADSILNLPVPGTMVSISPSFEPALIKGLTVHKDNPFLFDFIVDPGQSKLSKKNLKNESERMIKYFFAALTIPDKDVWVNLSPYEKDRMIPKSLGVTAMGRDLLAQDYMLKQLTASLIYPQKSLGKTFWDTVYSKAKAMYGTTEIPVNTFNKVWIVPQSVGIYEHGQTAYIVSGHLKVMLEEDYLSLTKHTAISSRNETNQSEVNQLGFKIIRSIILPEIEKEINDGKNFATLRQIFYAQALAVWFKNNLKQALLNQVYANKDTVKGIDQNDTATNEAIYHQYLRAYKKGVFNFIKEDIDPVTQETLPRKYFSGGYEEEALEGAEHSVNLPAGEASEAVHDFDLAVLAVTPQDAAMINRRLVLTGLAGVAVGVAADEISRKFKVVKVPAESQSTVGSTTVSEGDILPLLNQLTIHDPTAAHADQAFKDIKGMGASAYPALRSIVLNQKVSTDPLKWAAYLAANLAPSDDEARAFVEKINNGPFPYYVQTEAKDGLNDRAMLNRRQFVASLIGTAAVLGAGGLTALAADKITEDNIIRLLNRLKISDPSAAKGSGAFQDILAMGDDAYPILREIILNHKVSTDSLKWAAYLAANLAPSDDEANAFVNKIRSGPFPDYVQVEAENGLSVRTPRRAASSDSVENNVIKLLNRLDIADPTAAKGSSAFQDILTKGASAYSALEDIVLHRKVSSGNSLKWAAYLAANLAPSQNEARAFVDKINSGSFPDYVRTEASNGLNDRAMNSTRREFLKTSALAAAALPWAGRLLGQTGQDPEIAWLRHNVFADGMPRSFKIPEGAAAQRQFWQSIQGNEGDAIIERMIINDGLSLYDGAVWLTALAFAGGADNLRAGNPYIQTLLSGEWGEMGDIRGYKQFTYQGKKLGPNDSLFFRTLSPRWAQKDPLTGRTELPGGFPAKYEYDPNKIVWADWKPITGENAWIMIGAQQLAHAKANGGRILVNSDEIKLAQSIVPALKALTSSIGAILHAPEGTFGKNLNGLDISNENNASAYAALRMLYKITGNSEYLDMMKGIESYVKQHAMNKNARVMYQGGSYNRGSFTPAHEFAVDVQTWSILVYSPKVIDEWYGQAGTAYQMWKATKELSGFYQNGKLLGVGYTNGHDVFSGEWSEGAVAACLELALEYANSHPDWAREALNDAISMTQGIESLAKKSTGEKGYLYVNKSVVIPFGWNGRPVESTASTGWAYYLQNLKNPFVLGGLTRWAELAEFKREAESVRGGLVAVAPLKNQPQAAQVQAQQSSSPVADNENDVITLLNRLKIADPSAAKGSRAFQDILAMGTSAYPALKGIVLNRKVSADSLKWAAYLAAILAPSDEEANAFVDKVNSSPFADYVKVEAGNGLSERSTRKSASSNQTSKQETKIISLLNQLRIPDPNAAHGSEAFQEILSMGHSACPALEGIVLNHKVSTDSLKWAAYLAAYLAPSTGEARAFVGKVNSGSFPDYVRAEANNGFNNRAMTSRREFLLRGALAIDKAMFNLQQEKTVDNADLTIRGGIDLSQQDSAIRITKDVNGGVKVNIDPALIARVEREGLPEVDPVIINMQPADIKTIFGVVASV